MADRSRSRSPRGVSPPKYTGDNPEYFQMLEDQIDELYRAVGKYGRYLPPGEDSRLGDEITDLQTAVRNLNKKIQDVDNQIPENLHQSLVEYFQQIIDVQTALQQHAQAINNAQTAIVQLQQAVPGGPLLQNIVPFLGTPHTLSQRRKRSKRSRRSRRSRRRTRIKKSLNKA